MSVSNSCIIEVPFDYFLIGSWSFRAGRLQRDAVERGDALRPARARNSLPDSPTPGGRSDFYIFMWAEFTVAL